MNKNNLDYGTMPIGQLIVKLAIPGVITMLVGSLNMVADGVFMGNFIGSSALAAVNLVMPIVMILFGLVDMVASGAGARIGVLLGEGKRKKASHIFSASTLMIFILSVIITIFSFFFAKDIIFALIEDEVLATLAYDYAKVFIPALPLIAPLFAFDNFLWICGKVHRSTWVNVWTSLLNIALNYLFIVHLGLGISYAALATVISMSVGSIFSILPFIGNKLEIKFIRPTIALTDLKMIIYNGSSEFFENISGSFMAIVTNMLMLYVAGANGVAAISVVIYIEMMLLPVLGGIIGSVQVIISFNYGARNYDRVFEIFKKICFLSAMISAAAFFIIILFPNFLVSLFSNENDVEMIEIATHGLLLYAPGYLFIWFNYVVGTFLSALEKPKESIILMSLDSVVLPLLFFALLIHFMGAYGIFLAQSLSAALTFLVSFFMWKKIKRSIKAKE